MNVFKTIKTNILGFLAIIMILPTGSLKICKISASFHCRIGKDWLAGVTAKPASEQQFHHATELCPNCLTR